MAIALLSVFLMTISELRKRLLAQAAPPQTTPSKPTTDPAIFPYWDLPDQGSATIRFLPDGNPDNSFFWVERAMLRLPFNGVRGQIYSKPLVVYVPCMEMWNEACPILAEVRAWLKDPSLEEIGRKYWKRRSYLFHGFVRQCNLMEPEKPASPIRRFIVNPQLFNPIRAGLLNPNIDELPTDYIKGLDFKIVKTYLNGYANYNKSNWIYKELALNEMEKQALTSIGIENISRYLPKKPNDQEQKAIWEMFEASIDGEAYNYEKWGEFYKPQGL